MLQFLDSSFDEKQVSEGFDVHHLFEHHHKMILVLLELLQRFPGDFVLHEQLEIFVYAFVYHPLVNV